MMLWTPYCRVGTTYIDNFNFNYRPSTQKNEDNVFFQFLLSHFNSAYFTFQSYDGNVPIIMHNYILYKCVACRKIMPSKVIP